MKRIVRITFNDKRPYRANEFIGLAKTMMHGRAELINYSEENSTLDFSVRSDLINAFIGQGQSFSFDIQQLPSPTSGKEK